MSSHWVYLNVLSARVVETQRMRIQSPTVETRDEIRYALALYAYIRGEDVVANRQSDGEYEQPRRMQERWQRRAELSHVDDDLRCEIGQVTLANNEDETYPRRFCADFLSSACYPGADGLDQRLSHRRRAILVYGHQHGLQYRQHPRPTTMVTVLLTPRSLISRSKDSFSRRSPVRYLPSSQLSLYSMKYTRTLSPGFEFLYT